MLPEQGSATGGRPRPRVLPLLASAFLVVWLGRNLVLDVGTLATPPKPPSLAVATDTYTIAFRQLAPRLPASTTIDLVTGPGVAVDSAYWWATYHLYPHNIRVNPPVAAPGAEFVVEVLNSGRPAEKPGYGVVEQVRGPNVVVVVLHRGAG